MIKQDNFIYSDTPKEVLENKDRWQIKTITSISRITLDYNDDKSRIDALENYLLFMAKQLDYQEKRLANLINNTK